jgi:type IV pilus assembly protein PilN
MIKINLLVAREERKKESIRKEVTIFVLAMVVVMVGIGFAQLMYNRQRDALRAEITDLEDKQKQLQVLKQQIKKAKVDKKTYQEKLNIIRSLNLNRTRPIKIMSFLASEIPEKMWLKSLDKKDQKLTLQGIALDDETIANFMKKLQQTKIFTAVELVVTERVKVRKLNLKKFTLICRIGI